MNYPDTFHSSQLDRFYGSEAFELSLNRARDGLLLEITDERKSPGSVMTEGERFILCELLREEEIDGAILAGITAAAKHLLNRKSMTPEQVGQALIDALADDITAIAERRAGDAE